MKRIIMFVLLFAALKVAGQTTGYLRFDTVRIMKQNGTCELYIINKTKDSLGVLTNVGGGLTQFKKSKKINDSTFVVGNDTISIRGGGTPSSWCVLNNLDKTGATDVSASIQSAINSGCKYVYMPSGTYLISTTIQMKDSVAIMGDGKSTVFKIQKNIPAFKCGWALGGNKAKFQDISFLGTYSDSTAQDGILVDSCNGVYINNVSAFKLAGWAIHLKRNGFCCSGYPGPRGVVGNIVSDCFIDSCYGGIMHDTLAEFNSAVNCTVVNGTYGLFTAAGSSRFEACNSSVNQFGLYMTGGSNNSHGTAVGCHFAHNKQYGVYITGATNGYRFSSCMIRQSGLLYGEIYIENSDNIEFSHCDIGTRPIHTINSTGIKYIDNLFWPTITWTTTGTAPTVIQNGETQDAISIKDVVNNNQLDIKYNNKLVDIAGNPTRLRMINDTLNFSNSGTEHYIAGGENSTDSLTLTSTVNSTKGRIKFGTGASVFNEANGRWGIGTRAPSSNVHIEGTGTSELRIKTTSTNGHASIFFLTDNASANGRILVGGSASAFSPNGVIFSSLLGPMAIVAEQSEIRFTKSTVINGSNEHARFLNNGNFLYNTTTNDGISKFQIHSTSRFDSLVRIFNVTAPPSTYNILVHGLTDSGTYQVPVSAFATGNTIYTGDGTLSGNRTVTGGNNSLTFDDIFAFRINSDYNVIAKANGTGTYSEAIIGASNQYWLGYTPTEGVYSKGVGIVIDTNENVGVGVAPPTTMPLYSTGASLFVQGLQSNHGNFFKVQNQTADFTVSLAAYFYTIDATSGNVTVTLPAASTAFGNTMGITYKFQRIDNSGNTVTIQRAGSDTVNGGTSFTLTTQYGVKEVQCTSTSTWAQW